MALPLQQFNQILHKAVPFKDTWVKEAYGPHNTKLNPKRTVERALYCVTPTPAVVEQFKKGNYDILLTHHPYVVGVPQWIAHTALDCTTGGLNDQWRDLFGLKDYKHFDGNLGWYGKLDRPHTLQELIAKSEGFVGAPLIGEHHGHEHPINSIVICTGLGGMVERQAHATGADCYVLGEATTHSKNSKFKARIETGHTLSESITGLNFFRKHLEPHGIIVDQADLKHDIYSGEVYKQPVYHSYFSEKGLGKPQMGSRYKPYKPSPKPDNAEHVDAWEDNSTPFTYDSSMEGGYEPIVDDQPEDLTDEADFDRWLKETARQPKAPYSPPKPSSKPVLDTSSRGTGIQGIGDDDDAPSAMERLQSSKKTPEKPPRPPGGDFPEGN